MAKQTTAKPQKPVEPTTDLFADWHAYGLTSAANNADFLKRLKHSYKTPLVVEGDEIALFVSSLVSICVKKPDLPVTAEDVTILLAKHRTVLGNVGSHTTKIPDTNRRFGEMCVVAVEQAGSGDHCLATSRTVKGRQVTGLSDAGAIPAMRFFSGAYQMDGEFVTMFEDIAKKGPAYRCIAGIVGDQNTDLLDAQQWAHDRLNSPVIPNVVVSGPIKALYMPVGGEDEYHRVTPLAPVALLTEFHRRLLGRRVPRGVYHVGGTKPANGGLLVLDRAGDLFHLRAEPPVMQGAKKRNLRPKFDYLLELESRPANAETRQRRLGVIKQIVTTVMEDDFLDPPYGEPVEPEVNTAMNAVLRHATFTLDAHVTNMIEREIEEQIKWA